MVVAALTAAFLPLEMYPINHGDPMQGLVNSFSNTLLVFIHTNSTRAHMPPVEVAHWPATSFKVALGDHALTLRNDVEIGFVPPAVADRERGQVAGLVGPGLAICAAAC